MTTPGILFIISAPSGAGKTSLVKALIESTPNVVVSVSHTTRDKRPGEEEGVDYHFVTQAAFDEMIKKEEFLEHANVYGKSYGTAGQSVLDELFAGNHVILEIDWQGAQQVLDHFPESISMFILPPSRQALRQRLESRKQDASKVIESRMEQADTEMSHCTEFDYIVVNDNFDTALADLQAIIHVASLETALQEEKCAKLLQELLAN